MLFLQYTSGSTSEPKGVMVSHDNILANCESVVDHLPIGVSWLPQYHDMGLIGYYIFFALKGGTTYGFSPVDFIQRPALWLETISKYRGTASSAPNFAYEYCLRPEKLPAEALERLDLSSLRFLMTAAEPVRANVCRDFIREVRAVRPESRRASSPLMAWPNTRWRYRITAAPSPASIARRCAGIRSSPRTAMPPPIPRCWSAAASRWARPRSGSSI